MEADVCNSLAWFLVDVEEGADELLFDVVGGCLPAVGFLRSGRIVKCLWLSVSVVTELSGSNFMLTKFHVGDVPIVSPCG